MRQDARVLRVDLQLLLRERQRVPVGCRRLGPLARRPVERRAQVAPDVDSRCVPEEAAALAACAQRRRSASRKTAARRGSRSRSATIPAVAHAVQAASCIPDIDREVERPAEVAPDADVVGRKWRAPGGTPPPPPRSGCGRTGTRRGSCGSDQDSGFSSNGPLVARLGFVEAPEAIERPLRAPLASPALRGSRSRAFWKSASASSARPLPVWIMPSVIQGAGPRSSSASARWQCCSASGTSSGLSSFS